jgi:transposase
MPPSRNTAREREVVTMFKQGMKASDIARHFGVSRERIRQMLARGGSQTSQPTIADRLDLADLFRRYQAGERIEDLAQEVEISRQYLYDLFRKHGFTKSRKGRPYKWTAQRVAEMHRDYMAGMTQNELAKKYGVKQTYISSLFIQRGLYRFPKHRRHTA